MAELIENVEFPIRFSSSLQDSGVDSYYNANHNVTRPNMDLAEARIEYHKMLKDQIRTEDYYVHIAHLIEAQPFFLPAHLEMWWRSQEVRDHELERRIAHDLSGLLQEFVKQNRTKELTKSELDELIIFVVEYQKQASVFEKFRLNALLQVLKANRDELPDLSPANKYLKLIDTYDIGAMKHEVERAAPFWWQVDVRRQNEILYHQHTRAIPLRRRSYSGNAPYEPHDGVHEGFALSLVERFPKTHDLILDIAERLNIALGRVVIVSMKPHTQAFRHYDTESYLIGRDRYHLVLKCGEKNLLSAGDENVNAAEGEVWFFDNKVMHRAHNNSDINRIHVIFDGYPLSK